MITAQRIEGDERFHRKGGEDITKITVNYAMVSIFPFSIQDEIHNSDLHPRIMYPKPIMITDFPGGEEIGKVFIEDGDSYILRCGGDPLSLCGMLFKAEASIEGSFVVEEEYWSRRTNEIS